MGALTSRQNIGVEEVDITVNHAYRYPPKSGMFNHYWLMYRKLWNASKSYELLSLE